MSISEMLAIVVCLFIGYWAVSKMMPKPKRSEGKAENNEPRDDPNRAEHEKPPHEGQASSGKEEKSESGSEQPGNYPAWYEILGTSPSASRDEIRRAYRQRMSEYHPDKVAKLGKELREMAENKSKEINSAYDFIMKQRTT